jgi:aryl-alcohol dehydrogenase-like predicted oxidoreductase
MQFRPLGQTEMTVSAVALGAWPIAGMTSPGANDADSLATIRACFDIGVNHIDTAFCYGREGESERLIAEALGDRRDEMVLATKGGLHFDTQGKMHHDARPETLRRQCETSLQRLKTDRVELLYLHAPDPQVPVAESAGELKRLLDQGKTRAVGVSNFNVQQLEDFSAECPITAYQPPYNMLQRTIEADTLPWCRAQGVSTLVYWPLLKGLLTGKFTRDHVFPPEDNRRKYAMFRGEQWAKNQDLLDELRSLAHDAGITVAQLVIRWTVDQPGVTSALCGAKRAQQIRDTAAAADIHLTGGQIEAIEKALQRRGQPVTETPV